MESGLGELKSKKEGFDRKEEEKVKVEEEVSEVSGMRKMTE